MFFLVPLSDPHQGERLRGGRMDRGEGGRGEGALPASQEASLAGVIYISEAGRSGVVSGSQRKGEGGRVVSLIKAEMMISREGRGATGRLVVFLASPLGAALPQSLGPGRRPATSLPDGQVKRQPASQPYLTFSKGQASESGGARADSLGCFLIRRYGGVRREATASSRRRPREAPRRWDAFRK